jgi:autotransporter-associated beta strand protein
LALAAPTAFSQTLTYNTAGTFNWVCPPGVTSIKVECWGGGGGGGAANNTATSGTINVAGGGGAGGAYARIDNVPVTPGQTYTITIPAAAAGAATNAATGTRGTTGGTVTFTGDLSTVVTAVGGQGGATRVANTTGTGAGGVGSTTGSTGDVLFAGGSSNVSTTSGNAGGGGGGAGDSNPGGNTTNNVGGSGGLAGGGIGGTGPTGSNNGNSGGNPGIAGGGSGARMQMGNGTARSGGAGGLGRMILTYTAPDNYKANNSDNLNLASSWSVGVPIGNPAVWNNTVTAANTVSLGDNLTFSSVQILDPAGPVTINAGNTLTVGSAAIDLDLALATQNLTLNCDVAMSAANVWDVAAGRSLSLGGTLTGSAALTKQGDGTATFTGLVQHTGATTVNGGSLVFAPGSTFSPGGVGGVAGKLTVNGPASATIAGTYNALGNSDAYFELRGGGVLNFSGTANLAGAGGVRIGEAGTGTMNMTAGSLTTSMLPNSNFVVGRSAGANGILNVSGGTLTVTNSGGLVVANTAGNTGIVNLSGSGNIVLSGTGASTMGPGTATINLNSGGTMTLGTPLTASGSSTINFDGGTLRAGRASTSFLPTTLTAINVMSGGAIIDTNGYNITIPEPLLSGTPGDGGLTKTGLQALTLGGANTYTGTTNVSAGSLKFSTASTNASNVVVGSGAGAGVRVDSTDAQFSTSSAFNFNSGTTVVIDYGTTAPSTTVAPFKVQDLTVGTGIAIRLEGDLLPTLAVNQTYPLVTWTGTVPVDASAFTGGLNHRLAGTFSVADKTLFFTVTANTIGAISWATGSGAWDTTSSNWRDGANALVAYADPFDDVLFADAVGAFGDPVVTLDTIVSPAGVKMKSTGRDYTITGIGSIAGFTGLTLDADNTRKLTLANANTYTGPTAIVAGTLQLGNGGTAGAINPASPVSMDLNGIFAVNQTDTVTQGTEFSSAPLTGTGSFTQAGTGTTILNVANTYSGITTVSAGTLAANLNTSTNPLGTSSVAVGTGATLLLDNFNTISGSTITVNNAMTGTGLIQLQFAASTNARNLQMPNVSGFGGTIRISSLGTTGDKWNATGVGASGAAVIIDGGNTLFLTGGTPSFAGGITLSGTGNTEGRGAIRLSNATLGGNLNLVGDATVNLDNAAAVLTGNIVSGAAGTQTLTLGATASTGGTLSGVIGGGNGTLNLTTAVGGTYTLTNVNSYTGLTTVGTGTTLRLGTGTEGNDGTIDATSGVVTNGTLSFARFGSLSSSFNISGSGNVVKTGPGTQTLSGTNTYAGTTSINQGTLTLSGATTTSGNLGLGSTGNTGHLIVATGGSFTTTAALNLGTSVSGHSITVQPSASLSVGSLNNPWGSDYFIDGTLNVAGTWTVSTNATTRQFTGAGTISANALTLGNASTGVNYTGTGTVNIANAVTVASGGAAGAPAYTQTSGTLNAGGILLGDNVTNTTGSRTFNLNGGRANLGATGIAATGTTTANRVVNLGAGTLGALADWSSTLAANLSDATTGTTVNTLDAADNTTPRSITLGGALSGVGALTKAGAGTLTLTGANNYSGATTVTGGTLALVGGSQASAITVQTGASLGFTLGSPTTSTAAVTLDAGHSIQITGSPSESSYTLMTASSINGTPVLANEIQGYALVVEDGTTLKLNAVGGNTFANWIAGFNVGGQTGVNGDFDNDGLGNAVENLLGSSPEAFSQGLTAVSSTSGNLVFRHTLNSTPASDLTGSYEWSTNLSDWHASGATVGGTTVVFGAPVVVTPGTPNLVQVTATISGTSTPKVFARFKATQN